MGVLAGGVGKGCPPHEWAFHHEDGLNLTDRMATMRRMKLRCMTLPVFLAPRIALGEFIGTVSYGRGLVHTTLVVGMGNNMILNSIYPYTRLAHAGARAMPWSALRAAALSLNSLGVHIHAPQTHSALQSRGFFFDAS